MSRFATFALFLAVMVGLTALAHYYVYARLVRDAALPLLPRRALTVLLIFLFLSIPGSIFLRRTDFGYGRLIIWGASTWLGLLLLFVLALGAADTLRWIWTGAQRALAGSPMDDGRRLALARIFAGLASLFAGGLGLSALRSGLGPVAVKQVEVELDRLPDSLDGFTLVQLTDLHVGPTIGRDFIQEIVRQVNALTPDAVAITGDLVDGSVAALREHVAPLAELRAAQGVYFVTGNHEYYSGVDDWCAELARLGIRVLRNERVALGNGRDSFDLAGVDDHQAHLWGGDHGADLPRALMGRDPSRELLLLAHQPKAIFEAERLGVGLQLSGHTHGGQIWPWNYLVRLQQPVVAGLARFGRTLVYVSRGTGYWGPPMRLGAPAEITRVVLRSKSRPLPKGLA